VAEVCAAAGVECRMLPALSELLNTDSFTVDRSTTAAGVDRGCNGLPVER